MHLAEDVCGVAGAQQAPCTHIGSAQRCVAAVGQLSALPWT